jgi:hypothetical protein
MMEEAPSRLPSHPEPEAFMRYFLPPAETRFYAGIDLHARSLFLCILDRDGQTRYARNLPTRPEPFLRAVQPFRGGLVVGCECMHCWYWLADTCREQDIAFVLGHASGEGGRVRQGARSAWPSTLSKGHRTEEFIGSVRPACLPPAEPASAS